MDYELIICVPSVWASRVDFLKAIVKTTGSEFMFAGLLLAHPASKDHVELEFDERREGMDEAFRIGGQGRLTGETLGRIGRPGGTAYLHFPLDIVSERERISKFTGVVARSGGLAVKVETSGVAHEWDRWFTLIDSANLFDTYCACVMLVGDEEHYFSCGMHNFGLSDAQVSNEFGVEEAADLMNRFNYYQIDERPPLESGHTFSFTAEGERFRLLLVRDERHPEDDLFHNPHGLWDVRRD